MAIIVQARMGSTRLPGKVLAPILGRPMLEFQLERLARVRAPAELVVATTDNRDDDVVASLAARVGVKAFRGSEQDVLSRFAGAAAKSRADVIVRTTADCPLIDPELVDRVLDRVIAGDCDYSSNTLVRTYPRGLDVEALTRETLDTAHREARLPAEREHVTLFVYRHPERFRLCGVQGAVDRSAERWTVDTPQDLALVQRIYEALYPTSPHFTSEDIAGLLDRNPSWRELNRDVPQKDV